MTASLLQFLLNQNPKGTWTSRSSGAKSRPCLSVGFDRDTYGQLIYEPAAEPEPYDVEGVQHPNSARKGRA